MGEASTWTEVKARASLRNRIAAALDKALPKSAVDVGFYQRLGVTPFVDIEAYDLNLESLADTVIAELGLHPVESLDRRFIRWVTAWRNNPEMDEHDE